MAIFDTHFYRLSLIVSFSMCIPLFREYFSMSYATHLIEIRIGVTSFGACSFYREALPSPLGEPLLLPSLHAHLDRRAACPPFQLPVPDTTLNSHSCLRRW